MLPLHDNPDPDLIRRTRSGSRDAFLGLVRRHAPAVRALVEARIPGSAAIDEHTALAFRRIHQTLFVVRELHWFHLFAVRTTQAHLDARALPADDPGPDSPPWLTRMSLSQREALFLAERALPTASFPAIEYLGIAPNAYEARVSSARAVQSGAQEWGEAELPPPPSADMPDRIAVRVDELLGPSREQRGRRRLPSLPLPLAFLLTLGLAGVISAFLFQLPSTEIEAAIFQPRFLEPGRLHRLLHRVEARLSNDARAELIAPDRIRLDAGNLDLRDEGHSPLLIEIGGRLFIPRRGHFSIVASGTTYSIDPQKGSGTLREDERTKGREVTEKTSWSR